MVLSSTSSSWSHYICLTGAVNPHDCASKRIHNNVFFLLFFFLLEMIRSTQCLSADWAAKRTASQFSAIQRRLLGSTQIQTRPCFYPWFPVLLCEWNGRLCLKAELLQTARCSEKKQRQVVSSWGAKRRANVFSHQQSAGVNAIFRMQRHSFTSFTWAAIPLLPESSHGNMNFKKPLKHH